MAKLKALIKELMLDQEKVRQVETKRQAAKQQINAAIVLQGEAQRLLDKAASQVQRKIKTFQTLDTILAEFKFAVKQKEATKQKMAKKQPSKQRQTAEQTMADIIACLDALPEDKRQAVLKAMQTEKET